MSIDDLKASAIQLKEHFRRSLLSPEYHPLPVISQLEMHARLIRKQCGVTRTHAKDMVAYYHGYSDWQHLLNGVRHRALPNIRTDIAFPDTPQIKQDVENYIRQLPDAVLAAFARHTPQADTLLKAVLEKRPEHLFDAEVSSLHRAFFPEEEYEPDTNEIVTALLFRDNCILSRLKYMRDNNLTSTNPHIENYRTGWRTYCYINLKNNNQVDVEIRELDSYIFPSAHLENFFTTPWHIPYIFSHLQQMMNSLRRAGYHGTVALHRVNNEGLLEYYRHYGTDELTRYSCADVPWIDERIAALNEALMDAGARAVNTTGGCLAFDF
ncbi:hypothetical protein [Vagococcus sp. WN89Y]|uniref:hypothetical protein n=1 Tax=Vagococcus sp. WN89Y TaxID=3457258 RepID=UPI003FCE26A8